MREACKPRSKIDENADECVAPALAAQEPYCGARRRLTYTIWTADNRSKCVTWISYSLIHLNDQGLRPS